MNATKQQDLQAVISTIQKKWGANAIRQGGIEKTTQYLSAGFAKLDALINGGVMRGAFTEIVGKPTSGMTTIALNLMARSQHMGDGVINIDRAAAFDPATARFCGVNVPELLLIRYDFETAVSLLYDIMANNFVGVVVFNTLPELSHEQHLALAQTINRLIPLLTHTQCALVVLTLATRKRSLISQYASLRLQTTFERYLTVDGEIQGYQSVVTILKHKQGNEGKKVPIQILFDQKISEWEL